MKKTMICKGCGKQIVKTNPRKEFCSDICKKVYFSKMKYPDDSEYVECKICGFRAAELIKHITKVHKLKLEEYCKLKERPLTNCWYFNIKEGDSEKQEKLS